VRQGGAYGYPVRRAYANFNPALVHLHRIR